MDSMDRHRYRCRKENPSFSSTLLDVIYRSIDDEKSVVYRKSMRNRQRIDGCFQVDHKQIADAVPGSGGSKNISDAVKSATGFESSSGNSNIDSSASRHGAGISSSEPETIYEIPARPRPIRTIIHDDECMNRRMYDQSDDLQLKADCEGRFVKTKSRAMKIYGYLKKGKQPISPGGRLATFLISLFRTTDAKKSKIPSPYTADHDEAIVHANVKSKSAPTSSFSRSCLSKTPSSSRGKLTSTGIKRFYPASEYSQPLGHGSDPPALKFAMNEELKNHFAERNRHIEETSMNILKKNYQRKQVEYVFNSINKNMTNNDEEDEAASYASSDLFELDHLSAIGIDQELPLYETTSVDVNRPIANGLLV